MNHDANPTTSAMPSVFQNVVEQVRASLPENLRKWEIDEHGCWVWLGGRHPNGWPGNTSVKGRKGNAYRLVWEAVNGRHIPEGLEADHVCGRGRFGCVNPFHITISDHRTNMHRSATAPAIINARRTHCVNGHELTPDNIIKQSAKAGGGRGCKACAQRRHKETAEKHRDRYRARQRERYWANHEEELRKAAIKREKNREHRRAYNRAYYARKKAEREAS